MKNRYVIVLAAGQGTRMKSKLFKVMHPVMGRPMVGHVVNAALNAKATQVITITGVGAETIQDYLGNRSEFVFQEEQLGTAHAVEQARDLLDGKEGTTVVLSGDTPLITAETLKRKLQITSECLKKMVDRKQKKKWTEKVDRKPKRWTEKVDRKREKLFWI